MNGEFYVDDRKLTGTTCFCTTDLCNPGNPAILTNLRHLVASFMQI